MNSIKKMCCLIVMVISTLFICLNVWAGYDGSYYYAYDSDGDTGIALVNSNNPAFENAKLIVKQITEGEEYEKYDSSFVGSFKVYQISAENEAGQIDILPDDEDVELAFHSPGNYFTSPADYYFVDAEGQIKRISAYRGDYADQVRITSFGTFIVTNDLFTETFKDYPTIPLNVEMTDGLVGGGYTTGYSFTPEMNGKYAYDVTSNGESAYVRVFDEDFNLVAKSEESATCQTIYLDMYAGKKYYLTYSGGGGCVVYSGTSKLSRVGNLPNSNGEEIITTDNLWQIDEEINVENIEEIVLNEATPVNISIYGAKSVHKFIPVKDGEYRVIGAGNNDLLVEVRDTDLQVINSGTGLLKVNLEAGKTYYITSHISAEAERGFDEYSIMVSKKDEIIIGDVNADEVINAEDALDILKVTAKLLAPTYSMMDKIDVDCDCKITAEDALLQLKYAARLIDEFPNTPEWATIEEKQYTKQDVEWIFNFIEEGITFEEDTVISKIAVGDVYEGGNLELVLIDDSFASKTYIYSLTSSGISQSTHETAIRGNIAYIGSEAFAPDDTIYIHDLGDDWLKSFDDVYRERQATSFTIENRNPDARFVRMCAETTSLCEVLNLTIGDNTYTIERPESGNFDETIGEAKIKIEFEPTDGNKILWRITANIPPTAKGEEDEVSFHFSGEEMYEESYAPFKIAAYGTSVMPDIEEGTKIIGIARRLEREGWLVTVENSANADTIAVDFNIDVETGQRFIQRTKDNKVVWVYYPVIEGDTVDVESLPEYKN